MPKLRYAEIKQFAQSHSVNDRDSSLNPCSLYHDTIFPPQASPLVAPQINSGVHSRNLEVTFDASSSLPSTSKLSLLLKYTSYFSICQLSYLLPPLRPSTIIPSIQFRQ